MEPEMGRGIVEPEVSNRVVGAFTAGALVGRGLKDRGDDRPMNAFQIPWAVNRARFEFHGNESTIRAGKLLYQEVRIKI